MKVRALLGDITDLDSVDALDHAKVFLAQLFPGEGVDNDLVAELVRRLDRLGYADDYSFEVFYDDYAQMPPAAVCARAMRSVHWIAERVARRSLPVLREVR